MVNNKNGKGKIILASAIALTAITAGVAGGLIGYGIEPNTVTETVTVEVPVTETITETIEVEVPVNVTVEKIVEVEDESFKAIACDRLLFDDLTECVEETEAEDLALQNVLNFIEVDFDEVAEELEDLNLIDDDNDVDLVKVYSDFEDIEVTESDFDDNEYEFIVKIKVDDDEADEKRYFYVTLTSEDGEIEIESITE